MQFSLAAYATLRGDLRQKAERFNLRPIAKYKTRTAAGVFQAG
jgi:hypothetical protein